MNTLNNMLLNQYSYVKVINAMTGLASKDSNVVAENFGYLNKVKTTEWGYGDKTDCTCESTSGCGALPSFCGFVMNYMGALDLQCENTFTERAAGMGCPSQDFDTGIIRS